MAEFEDTQPAPLLSQLVNSRVTLCILNVFNVNKKDTRTKADDLVIVSLLMILKTFSKPLNRHLPVR